MQTESDNNTETPENESLQDRVASLSKTFAEQITAACEAERNTAVLEAVSDARRQTVEKVAGTFAEIASRIRREDSVTGIATALVEGAARFSGRAALFIHRGDQLLGFRVAGEPNADKQAAFQRLSIAVRDAASAAHSIESLDAVVTTGIASDLSAPVVELFEVGEQDRIYLLPVCLRDKVLALIYCDNRGPEGETAVLQPAIETLISLAEAWIEAVGTRRKQAAA